jgi:hypothetical protein
MKFKPVKDPTEIELTPLAQHPRYVAALKDLRELEQRLAQAEQRQRVAEARRRGQKPTASLADRAKALVAGGHVPAGDPGDEIGAALEERNILHPAIVTKREELQTLAAELSFEVCKEFAPHAADALRAALAAADQLFAALEAGRVLRGRIIGAGFSINENALPVHPFSEAAVLGDSRLNGIPGSVINGVVVPGQSLSHTPAFRFRCWLRSKGIIDA